MNIVLLVRHQWDRVSAFLALVLGGIVLILGYLGISSTGYIAEQLPYFISAGIVAVMLLGLSGMLWISADLRDEWTELHAIRTELEAANQLRVRGDSTGSMHTPAPLLREPDRPSSNLDDLSGETGRSAPNAHRVADRTGMPT